MKATYVTIWDGGTEIRTNCHYDPDSKEVTNIESVNVNVEILEDEYIEFEDGTQIRDFIRED